MKLSSVTNKRIKIFLRRSGFICLLLIQVMAGAQIHNITLTVPKPNPLPPAVAADYSFNTGANIGIGTAGVHVATTAAMVQWNFLSVPSPLDVPMGVDNFVFHGITVKLPAAEGVSVSSASNITITGTPTAGITSFTFSVKVNDASDVTNSADAIFTVLIHQPVDLVMVLDRSGSMGWGFDGSLTPANGQRRWDGLVTGIGVLQAQLQGAGVLKTGDKLGMRMFASIPNVINPAAPFNGGLVDGPANVASLSAVLSGVVPNNGTALGDGIIAGRNLLWPGTVNNKKAMIVFSDGVQNEGTLVNTNTPNQYTHAGTEKLSSPGNEIKIHTICLGSTGHNPMLMQEIANANGGKYLNASTGAAGDFTTFFTTHLTTILSGNSPQLVDIKKDAFPASPGGPPPVTEKSFSINKGTRAVVITLIVPSRNEPRFTSVQKDGTELIQFAQRTSGPGYISIAIRYPLSALPITALNGEWKVKAQLGTSVPLAVPYSMLVVTDDHFLHPSYSLGSGNFKVNAVFNPRISLMANGRAIRNATAQVIVVKPGDDINDLVAAAKVQFAVPPGDPGSPDVAKLAELMKDTAFLNKIKAKEQVLNMAFNAGDSMYAGTYNGLDIAGVYQAVYRITANDPGLGRIERFHQESFYVRFPDIDLSNSQMVISTNAAGFSVISFRPRASNKKLIGPGWGPSIVFESGSLKATDVVDKGDGSYEITLNGKLSGAFTLSLGGETVFKGKPGEISCYGSNANFFQKIKCWLISKGLPEWSIWVILFLILLIIWAIIRRLRR